MLVRAFNAHLLVIAGSHVVKRRFIQQKGICHHNVHTLLTWPTFLPLVVWIVHRLVESWISECKEIYDLRLNNLNVLSTFCDFNQVDLDVSNDVFGYHSSIRYDKTCPNINHVWLVILISLGISPALGEELCFFAIKAVESSLSDLEGYLERIVFAHNVEKVFMFDLKDGSVSRIVVHKYDLFVSYYHQDFLRLTWKQIVK